jgi:hypothetical protein
MRLEAWLAQMPKPQEIDEEIAELERKLELLRVVKEAANGGAPAPTGRKGNGRNGNGHSQGALPDMTTIDPMRISAERREILEVMVTCPGLTAGATLVQKKLKARGRVIDVKPIQTNLGRMYKIGLLERVKKGRYRVLPHAAEFIRAGEAMN